MEHCYKTFISLGNSKQSFVRLLKMIEEKITLLPKPILIQTGHTSFQLKGCDIVDFIEMEKFTQYVSAAEILIFHAGAGSILHAIRSGKFPIIVARRAEFFEHINNHQVEFANALQSLNKVIAIDNSEALQNAIIKILSEKKINHSIENKSTIFNTIHNQLITILGT